MESFIDRVARIYNGVGTRTMEQAIGEAKRLSEDFEKILSTRVIDKVEKVVTPEEVKKSGMEAISDYKDSDRPEAANAPDQTIQRSEGMEI